MATARQGKAAAPAADYTKSTAREYFESICVAVILALFVRTFIVQAFKIPTGSMENNLLIGDHLLVNKFVFAPTLNAAERTLLPIDPIRRGDIIVFKYPEEPERDFIKRTIGLPGETIELRNKRVYINDKPLDEYFSRETGRMIVRQPLELVQMAGRFDVNVAVDGGGITGQAGAIRRLDPEAGADGGRDRLLDASTVTAPRRMPGSPMVGSISVSPPGTGRQGRR